MNLLWSWIDTAALGLGALEMLVKLTLVLGAISLLGLMTNFTAATKRLLWSAAIVIALLLPLASGVLPAIEVPLQSLHAPVASVEMPIAPNKMPMAPVEESIAPMETSAVPVESSVAPDGASETASWHTLAQAQPVPTAGTEWFSWQGALALAVAVWLLGVAFFAARLLRQHRQARAIRDNARPFPRANDGSGTVPVLVSDDIATPIALGVLKLAIVLPVAAQQWDAPKWRSAIAHELAHVKGRDNLLRFCASVLSALYWFHPLVWYSARKLHEEQEKAADNAVINQGVRASTYAQNLLEIVKSLQGNTYDSNVSASMASYSFFPQRMRSILSDSQNRQGPGWAKAAVMLLAIGAIALPVTLLTTQPSRAQETVADTDNAAKMVEENAAEERTLYIDFAQNAVTEQNPRPDLSPARDPLDPVDPIEPLAVRGQQPAPDPALVAPFQELEAQIATAFNKRDVDTIVSFYADEAQVLVENDNLRNETHRGKRAIKNYWNDLLDGDMMLRSQVQSVNRDGDKARVTTRYWASFNTDIGNLNDFFGGITTTDWQLIDGQWRIVNDIVHEPDYVSEESIQRIVDTALGAVEAIDWEGISHSIEDAVAGIAESFDFNFDMDFNGAARNWSRQNRDANSPLLNAVESGNSKSVRALLENGADANASAMWGRSALYLASEMGNKAMVEQLLKHKADVNAASRYGKTALYVAAENGHLDVVKLLVKNKAEVNQRTRYGKSPLSAAAAEGHDAVVEYLLERGADVNA
ncbi:MAG: ankyrin repeat domain-containing protein [Cellvibrionaceae bacterium]